MSQWLFLHCLWWNEYILQELEEGSTETNRLKEVTKIVGFKNKHYIKISHKHNEINPPPPPKKFYPEIYFKPESINFYYLKRIIENFYS